MNVGYSSSSDDEEELQVPAVPQTRADPTISRPKNLGAAVRNTFNDLSKMPEATCTVKSSAKVTDFVPSSLRHKSKSKKKPVPTPAALPQPQVQQLTPINLNLGNIFESKDPSTDVKARIRSNNGLESISSVQMVDFKGDTGETGSLGLQLGSESVSDIEMSTTAVEQPNSRKSKRTIDESKIIDFDLDHFYNENNELISKGDLNFEEHQRQHKKVKYYNTTGTNQLSDLMRFSAQNTDKLNDMYDKELNLKSGTANRYGFKR